MKAILSNILSKSLLIFILSLLGSWNRTALLFKPEELSQTPQVLDIKNKPDIDLAAIPCLEVYSCFLWFLSMLSILEIISFGFTSIRIRSDKIVRRRWTFDLKDFIKHYVKVLVRYSLCYLLYMSIVFAAYFVCNIYTSTEGSSRVETTPLTISTDRNLQETYSDINMGTGITGELISPSSSSTLTKSIFLIETDPHADTLQILISSDSNTAFALTFSYDPKNITTLLIFNVTRKDSPSLIVNFPLFANDSSYEDVNILSFIMVLSSDDKTMVIGTYYALQVVDVSNLTSPVSLCIISQVNTTYDYINISPDGQTIFVSTITEINGDVVAFEVIDISNTTSPTVISSYNPLSNNLLPTGGGDIYQFIISDDYSTVFLNYANIEIVNITNLQSPQLINSINNMHALNLQIYQGKLYAETYQSLLIYNISDLGNIVPIANLDFSESYENYTVSFALWAISDQLGFIVYQSYDSLGEQNLLRIVNISNNTINAINSFNIDGLSVPSLAESPDGRYVFFSDGVQLYVYDIALQSLSKVLQVQLEADIDFNYDYTIVSSDGKTLFIATYTQLWIVEFNFDMEARQALDLLANQVRSIEVQEASSPPVCSKTNKLYITNSSIDDSNGHLTIVDITNPASYVVLPSTTIPNVPYQISVSSDEQYLFGITWTKTNMSQFAIYNLSDGQIVSSYSSVPLTYKPSFVMTPDSNTVLILQGPQNFFILDVSNRTEIQLVSNMSNSELYVSSVTLSNDGKAVFLMGTSLWIYDISTPSNPSLVSIYNHLPGIFMAIAQSLDGNTLFATTTLSPSNEECTLNIIDASSLKSPTLITSTILPDACFYKQQPIVVPMISNEQTQTLFLPLNQSLAVIDVTLIESPTALNYYLSAQPNVIVSSDYRTLIINFPTRYMTWMNISLITLTPENILYSVLHSFPLGQTNSTALGVFTRNPSYTYDIQLSNHKFIDMSLSVPIDTSGTMVQTDEILPNWVTFDQSSGRITFAPNSGSRIGVYVLSGTLSKQIPNNTFIGIGPINNTNDSFNLFYTLVISGYLDNQGYLTPSFDSAQPLLLPSPYINEELLIRQRLANYSIQASMPVFIIQSLTLTLPDSPFSPISIDTLSLEPLNVIIILDGNGNGTSQQKFVTTGYSFTASFSQNNTVVSLVMSLLDVNTALSQLIVFLNGSQSCIGNITIRDGLNPTLIQIVPDISQYFKINSQPIINVTYFQSQLAKVSPKTGEQFVFQIDSSTFSDANKEPLTLSIQMNDGSPAPQWLELRDLSLIGTFPDQITGREVALILTVSNQYQSNEIGFTLDVGISLEYAFRLIGTYGGALITLIGLLVYAPRIYNIFAKRYYRYPKDFVISVGQQINPKILYPIYFGLEPLRESKLIMHNLDKKIAKKIGNTRKDKIAEYFTDSNSDTCKIDRAKLTETIEHTAAEIREKDGYKLRLYTPVLISEKELINQLIINNYIMRLLDSDKAKPTKAVFNLIKRHVLKFVNLDKCLHDGFCTFSVNKARLDSELRKHNLTKFEQGDNNQQGEISGSLGNLLSQSQPSENQTKQESMKTELLPKVNTVNTQSQFNINMLIYVMEAYAFNQQIIDADALKIDVMTKERLPNIWTFGGIRRFLKLDLEPINLFKKGRICCGIKYNMQENCLIFNGTAKKDIKDKTIVIQIVTRREKILREIWIHGMNSDANVDGELMINQL